MIIKRMIAYLFDILFVAILSSLIFSFTFKNSSEEYQKTIEEYLSSVSKLGSADKIKDEDLRKIAYKYAKSTQTLEIISVSTTIIYFVFLQYFMNGQTLGKRILKIQVAQIKSKSLNPNMFILRETVLLALPLKIIDVICLINLNMNNYFKASNIINDLNTIIIIIIMGTIIFRKDNRGLHELISNTKVIDCKKQIEEEKND